MLRKSKYNSSNIKEDIILGILLIATTTTISTRYLAESNRDNKGEENTKELEYEIDYPESKTAVSEALSKATGEEMTVEEKEYENDETDAKVTIVKFGYVSERTIMYDENLNEIGVLDTYQKVAVYSRSLSDNLVMVEHLNDNGELIRGYINIYKIIEMPNTYVEVDISSQTMYLYINGELALTSPVVTGKPATPTHEGYFDIYYKEKGAVLRGYTSDNKLEYESYVDYWMPFDGGIGFHDAERHTHEDGFSHGWRVLVEFGGETYLLYGSHGCVNLPHEVAKFLFEHVLVNETKVLVHY